MASPASAQSFQNNDIIPAARNKQSSVSDIQALASNSRIIWGMIAAMSVAAIVAYRSANLSFAWSSNYKPLLIVLLFLVVSCCYRKLRPDPRIIFSTEGCAQLMIILSLGCALSYPLAITGFPYQDAALHSVDTWMGLDWRTYLHFVNARPVLCVLSELAYRSMILQFLVLIVTLVATSRFLRLQQYILATASALAITLVIFAFVPAGGTYAFLHIPPSEFANLSPTTTADQMVHLDALRAGQHTVVSNMEGLITFPSFHTVWAALFMWGFFPIRELRFGAIFLNLFVIASTPIQGAHYFIDLIGGVIVAVIAICAAALLTRHAPRWP
jgi:membrane-associated phospholipid phosphatase